MKPVLKRQLATGLAAGILAALSFHASANGTEPPGKNSPPGTAPEHAVKAWGNIRGMERARQRSDGAVVVSEKLAGHGWIQADDVIVKDELAPGNSPGCINFSGNVTLTSTSTLVMELDGLTPCLEHDQISVANSLGINNASLQLVLLNYTPVAGDSFDILDWGSLTGQFATIDASAATLPAGLSWDFSQLYTTGEIMVVSTILADGDLAPWDNPDGLINVADMLIMSQISTGLRTPGQIQLAHGDLNQDGVINVQDILLLQIEILSE